MTGQIFVFEVAKSFRIAAPGTVTAGRPFAIIVSATGQNNTTDAMYGGTIRFSSSDSDPAVQLPPDYTFLPADNGMHTFTGLVLKTVNTGTILTVTATGGGLTGQATIKVDGAAPQAPNNLRVSP